MPKRLVADARDLGFTLEIDAARMLVERMGARPVRLRTELERLALWAGEGGTVGAADLDAMISDTSEEAIWTLADAIIEGDEAKALRGRRAARLAGRGAAADHLLGRAPPAPGADGGARDRGRASRPKDVASGLSMHPYAAKMLVQRVRGRSPADLDALDPRARRPRALVARRLGLPRAGRVHARPAQGGRRRRARRPDARSWSRRAAWPRGTSCGRRCCGASRRSGRPCRCARRAPCARRRRSRRRPRRWPPRGA